MPGAYLEELEWESPRRFALEKEVTIIGKWRENVDICLDVPTVSRMHGKIIHRKGKDYLIDLNSRNGTMLNEIWINPEEEYELKNGDILVFAPKKISICVYKRVERIRLWVAIRNKKFYNINTLNKENFSIGESMNQYEYRRESDFQRFVRNRKRVPVNTFFIFGKHSGIFSGGTDGFGSVYGSHVPLGCSICTCNRTGKRILSPGYINVSPFWNSTSGK